MAADLDLRADAEGVNLAVRVRIRASRTRITAIQNGQLVVAIAAPPVEGEANLELRRHLAKVAGLTQSQVTLEGERARNKRVRFAGVSEQALRAVLTSAVGR
jgi:hypothetical protein